MTTRGSAGPGSATPDEPESVTLGWMKGDRKIYFQSERTGFSHLYTAPFAGGEAEGADVGPVGGGQRGFVERQEPVLSGDQRRPIRAIKRFMK